MNKANANREYYNPAGCGFVGLLLAVCLLSLAGCSPSDLVDEITDPGSSGDRIEAVEAQLVLANQRLAQLLEEQRLTRGEINQEGGDIEAAIVATQAEIRRLGGELAEMMAASDGLGDLPEGGEAGTRDLSVTFSELNAPRFVWKPVSEGDGNLVILVDEVGIGVPVRSLSIFYADGNVIRNEVGVNRGLTNGDRPTFRFSRPGCGYGGRVLVETGDTVLLRQTIPDGCRRWGEGGSALP